MCVGGVEGSLCPGQVFRPFPAPEKADVRACPCLCVRAFLGQGCEAQLLAPPITCPKAGQGQQQLQENKTPEFPFNPK